MRKGIQTVIAHSLNNVLQLPKDLRLLKFNDTSSAYMFCRHTLIEKKTFTSN